MLLESEIPEAEEFLIRDSSSETVSWNGRRALRLSGQGPGLVLHRGLMLDRGRIEVDLGSEAAAYPGIVFRAADTRNYELAYAQPHTSGRWDALQYDPVFHGSNTWQMYFGDRFQRQAEIPLGTWIRLRLEFLGRRALLQAGEQPPLIVEPLAHAPGSGRIGLWTYLPAYFANLRVWDDAPTLAAMSPSAPVPFPEGFIREWFLDGYGAVQCEPNGILNLNRFLPASVREVRLDRRFELAGECRLKFHLGFSDELSLKVDGREIFAGRHTWKDTSEWADRGYSSPDFCAELPLARGTHTLAADVKATEYFGFGLAVRVEGSPSFLPVGLMD